jgi:hypothetical protein
MESLHLQRNVEAGSVNPALLVEFRGRFTFLDGSPVLPSGTISL